MTPLRPAHSAYLKATSGAPETFSTLDEAAFAALTGEAGCSTWDEPEVLSELLTIASVGTTLQPARVRVGGVEFGASVATDGEVLRVTPSGLSRELPEGRALVSLLLFDSSYCFAAEQLGRDGDAVRLGRPSEVVLRRRRARPRRKLARPLPAALVLGGGTASCAVRDITEDGAGVAAPMIGEADVPAVHALRLDLPSGALLAQVSPRWSHQAGAQLYLGVAFRDFGAASQLDLVEQRHTNRQVLDPSPACRLVRADGEALEGQVADIGDMGARLDVPATPSCAGAGRWTLTMHLEGGDLTVEADQRWCRSDEDGQSLGVRFIPPAWARR